jgi:excinuclease ABC subunit A
MDRAKTIAELWLGYISLNRQVGTLSGWEIQRLRLTKQLGNKLTGIIYVLDEPTIGLNKKEIIKVIEAIKGLQTMGNTIIVGRTQRRIYQSIRLGSRNRSMSWRFWLRISI